MTKAQAQTIHIIDETPQFVDYLIQNDSLQTGSPVNILIPYNQGTESYRVLEQMIVPVNISGNKRLMKVNKEIGSNVPPLMRVVNPGMSRKRQVATLRIYVSRPSGRDDLFLVVKYMKIRVFKPSPIPQQTSRARLRTFQRQTLAATSTPLSSGQWYKIPFSKNGIYRIDATYLKNLGIDVNNIDPRNIQIWGTNGYELPNANSSPWPEFKQIPIIVSGESDGKFDSGDYILFYGNSPNEITYDSQNNTYSHHINPYSTENYVFLTIGSDRGLRLAAGNNGLTANRTVQDFPDFIWKEQELTKSEAGMKSGTQWLGQTFTNESFASNQAILQDTIPGLIPNSTVQFNITFAARSQDVSTFYVTANSQTVGQVNISSILDLNGDTGYSGHESTLTTSISNFTAANDILNVSARFGNPSSSSQGWLDWIEMTIPRKLVPKNGRLYFFSPSDGQSGDVGNYVLSGFKSQPVVMDVTNPVSPVLMNVTSTGQNYDFNFYANPGRQMIAQTDFYTPDPGTSVANQDLHGISDYPNYIIVTAPKFLAEANDLANYRKQKSGLRPVVVTQEQIFNEFSGGVPDVSAIRNFVRYLYEKAGTDQNLLPKYLLLFGDATYDYKGIIKDAPMKNYVFTYESKESLQRIESFASDDYFGLLDPSEGNWTTSSIQLLDIGIGRLPVQTEAQAKTVVQKIKDYDSSSSDGDWRSLFTFVADDDLPNPDLNRDLHVLNADSTAAIVENSDEGLHVNKVYEFSYPVENTTAGRRIPLATDAFINSINNGTLVINYSGHGGEEILSDERLFVSNYISQFTNKNKLSIFVTATCQFGRYDDTDQESGAEQTVLYPDGGMVAAFTTTRVVYTSSDPNSLNFGLNRLLTQYMSTRDETTGEPRTLGDIYRLTKITGIAGPSFNSRKFILLGDPAVQIGIPRKKMMITQINNITNLQDSTINLRALDHVTVKGDVINNDSTVDNNFNGIVNMQVYDASRYVKLPERSWMQTYGCYIKNCQYKVQKDVLFSGRASVTNGRFTANFIIPKDMSYSDRKGKILLYADETSDDAAGEYSNFTLSGTNPDAVNDKKGPQISIYLNNDSFIDGSMVNDSPNLIVDLKDPSGINTTGNGVGHDIIAQLSSPNQPDKTIVLNDYYTSNLNDYASGKIEYPLNNLPNGNYVLNIRAWDVFNNESQSQISFTVAKSQNLTIRRVYNFPNPMNNETKFIIEHNQPGNPMTIDINIYTLSGRPVAHIERDDVITSSPYVSINWYGRDDDNDPLATGTYLYVVHVKTNTDKGEQSVQKIEKLVIIH